MRSIQLLLALCLVKLALPSTSGDEAEVKCPALRRETRQPVPFAAFESLRQRLDAPFFEETSDPIAASPEEAERFLAQAEPGDTIRIRKGDYTDWGELQIAVGGQPGRPITLPGRSQYLPGFVAHRRTEEQPGGDLDLGRTSTSGRRIRG
jgi:hypothetical protein